MMPPSILCLELLRKVIQPRTQNSGPNYVVTIGLNGHQELNLKMTILRHSTSGMHVYYFSSLECYPNVTTYQILFPRYYTNSITCGVEPLLQIWKHVHNIHVKYT